MGLFNLKLEKQNNDEDLVFLRLYCWNCDAIECKYAKKYAPINSLNGCNRQVLEENFAQYIHYLEEVMPYWKQYSADWVNDSYFEINNFLQNNIYNQPITALFNGKGEIVKNERNEL